MLCSLSTTLLFHSHTSLKHRTVTLKHVSFGTNCFVFALSAHVQAFRKVEEKYHFSVQRKSKVAHPHTFFGIVTWSKQVLSRCSKAIHSWCKWWRLQSDLWSENCRFGNSTSHWDPQKTFFCWILQQIFFARGGSYWVCPESARRHSFCNGWG